MQHGDVAAIDVGFVANMGAAVAAAVKPGSD